MSHEHRHEHGTDSQDPADLRHMFTAEFWDERYAGSDRVWSGHPNAALVEEVDGLAPATAVDVGCGEGADVVWLASRGWKVTGVDVSGVALAKAAEHAARAGVADRTSWQRADVFALDPLPVGDLVTASYVHVPPDLFAAVYGHVAASVAPGGTLVVLAHHPDDQHTGLRNSDLTHLLFTPEAVTALLDPADWEVVTSRVLTREHVHEGTSHQVSDTVVRAVRRS
ncbi:class I SAM-dependent methyltransferase [Nocardioides rubriscoriae]|uniref:class I SAM-dependent methyltransferase n=1 Tax=Nocardioides rubriscoriae TaxID=642762 RepID=UPI001B87CE4C|nr:class I SAM-dependent methyltransferase [Nocardioides rubriscoriae]